MSAELAILGQGVYSPRDAARLIGSTPQDIRRWTHGSGPYDPLWTSYFKDLDDTAEISFRDLIEVRVVKAFRLAGVSMQAVRFAIQFAKEKFEVDHPLTSLGFKISGSEILMQALDRESHMVSLSKNRAGQKVFTQIVQQSLRDLEYEHDQVVKWRPEKYREILIDPNRLFGKPQLEKFGVPTWALYSDYKNFKDIDYLSVIYEIPEVFIREAIAFETSLDQANG